MCGIAGIWGNASRERLKAMAAALQHRGPDGEGFYLSPNKELGLAHRRLAIIDLETGAQPMASADGQVHISFNGAIYNYKELQVDLQSQGAEFRTQSDTECIIQQYQACRDDAHLEFVNELRGMFAFALWDQSRNSLILARDPAGKKPLYYADIDGEIVFASELGAVVAAYNTSLPISNESLCKYLSWYCVPPPSTIYEGVYALLPGEVIEIRDRRIVARRRFSPIDRFEKQGFVKRPLDEIVDRTEHLLQEAVKIRLRADVPVGTFLSGGIDSGLITAMAAKELSSPLRTVTVGFKDESFDERPLAREVAYRYRTDHCELTVKPDPVNDLPGIAMNYGQPFADSSAIPSWYVAREARKHVPVVLNGDGGDEVFRGYRRYLAAKLGDMAVMGDWPLARSFFSEIGSLLPVPGDFRSRYAFAYRFIRGMGLDRENRYRAWSQDAFSNDELRGALHVESGLNYLADGDLFTRTLDASGVTFGRGQSFYQQMLLADFHTVLPADLLVKMDIACMGQGLESRSPLLDRRLIEETWGYEPNFGIRSFFQTKPVLRELAKRYLPESIVTAPKRGFEVPLIQWLRSDLNEAVRDTLLSRNGLVQTCFSRPWLEDLLAERLPIPPGSWSRRVWALLMLGMWDNQRGTTG